MGANGELKFGDCEILGFRNQVSDDACLLFQESDRKHETGRDLEGGHDTETSLRYETTVLHAKARLALMGFSLQRTKELFSKGLEEEVSQERASSLALDESDCIDRSVAAESLKNLEAYNFETWQKCARHLLTKMRTSIQYIRAADLEEVWSQPDIRPKYLRHLSMFENFDWGIPGFHDIRQVYSGLLPLFPDHERVVLECGDLVDQRWLEEDASVVQSAWLSIRGGLAHNEPVIILTEGSTDATVLRQSLSVLYQEYDQRFQFLDFSGISLKGGASSLVDQLKAFAAAGLHNRILAILDNDAAGRDALRGINNLRLPDNMGAMHLPDVEIANDYPTIGPQGRINANVNGQAVSIEMFAGKGLLFDPENLELGPIVWRGYVEGVKAYQGELRDKTRIQQRLQSALASGDGDFSDLRILWQSIFLATERLR